LSLRSFTAQTSLLKLSSPMHLSCESSQSSTLHLGYLALTPLPTSAMMFVL